MDYGWHGEESWKQIPKTPYELSNRGQVRRWHEKRGEYVYLKPEGLSVRLTKEKKRYNIPRLMAEVWGVRFAADEIGEEWKDVKGHEGAYQVSNMGRVRSKARYIVRRDGRRVYMLERIIKQTHINSGYRIINLHNEDGTIYHKLVHRLVAEHFIPNIENLEQVNHKDEDKHNNKVSNLEWCTREYNAQYGTNQERRIATRLKNNGGKYGVQRRCNRHARIEE